MFGVVSQPHVRQRLRVIHLNGIGLMVLCFFLLVILGRESESSTLPAQFIVLAMALILAISYGSLLFFPKDKDPVLPLIALFLLNLATTALVWATGIIESPFILLYVILIMVVSELYHYRYGLLQAILAMAGFVTVYSAAANDLISVPSLLPIPALGLLYQPPLSIFVYGLLYGLLLIFTSLSSSSARFVLYSCYSKVDLSLTWQEKIIREVPIGIVILDTHLNILGANPYATLKFPYPESGTAMTKYLTLSHTNPRGELERLSATGVELRSLWQIPRGRSVPVTFSVRLIKDEPTGVDKFVIFLRP